eukprot:3928496-Pyramimonas_sp.AAC.1
MTQHVSVPAASSRRRKLVDVFCPLQLMSSAHIGTPRATNENLRTNNESSEQIPNTPNPAVTWWAWPGMHAWHSRPVWPKVQVLLSANPSSSSGGNNPPGLSCGQ